MNNENWPSSGCRTKLRHLPKEEEDAGSIKGIQRNLILSDPTPLLFILYTDGRSRWSSVSDAGWKGKR